MINLKLDLNLDDFYRDRRRNKINFDGQKSSESEKFL